MLSPDDRVLLVDLLAPPAPGYRLEHALATTFTLHLQSLLPVPLALAGAELSESSDPLGILQAIRTFADRIDVFCQAGQVAVPTTASPLFAFLEPTVHQVRRPSPGHLFHPKLWLLRFANEDGDQMVRLVCGSRNLTADRAWDAVVSLDGTVTAQPKARNRPLHDLIASLPTRVPAGITASRQRAVAELADLVRYVDWERPEGAVTEDWLYFHTFGPTKSPQPNLDGSRRLIISPFLNEKGIEQTWTNGEATIVSRAESLDALSDDYHRQLEDWNTQLLVLDENAAIPDLDDDDAGPRWTLAGLHAKTYLIERGHRTHLFIGSANATDAAFGGNDEILIEIVGRKSAWGVNETLADKTGSLAKLLVPYTRNPLPEDPEGDLRRQLENALRTYAELTYTATISSTGDDTWDLHLATKEPAPAPPDTAELTVRPLTLATTAVVDPGAAIDATWTLDGVEQITPFIALTLTAPYGSATVEATCTIVARLIGAPDDRLDRILASHIGTPGAFIRFLLLLLQLAGRDATGADLFGGTGNGGGFDQMFTSDNAGILEAVTTALASHPEAIDDVDRLVNRLSRTDQGRELLPIGWEPFWTQVTEARRRIGAMR
jgi:hypothetical protein